jgi:hypothetical protein
VAAVIPQPSWCPTPGAKGIQQSGNLIRNKVFFLN